MTIYRSMAISFVSHTISPPPPPPPSARGNCIENQSEELNGPRNGGRDWGLGERGGEEARSNIRNQLENVVAKCNPPFLNLSNRFNRAEKDD